MSVEKTALLPVSADEAFALVTEPDRLRRWQTVAARVDLRAGGEYRWTVVPGRVATGTFREVEPGRRVVFGWGWDGSSEVPPDSSTVTITLEPADGGTLVRLVHEGLEGEQEAYHGEGWSRYLERLQRAAVTGDAGPDEWAAAPAELDPITAADAALAVCQQVLRGVGEGDLDRQTPCTEYDVRQLADHLLGALTQIAGMAGAEISPAESGDLESRIAYAAQQTLEAWYRRGLDGTVRVGDREMPAAMAAGILSLEFLVHGWDFATATGQKVVVSEDVARFVLDEVAVHLISAETRAAGSFGEPVDIAPDAPVLDRLIAFSGRAAA